MRRCTLSEFLHEVWLPIPGYERRYEASSLGRVRSLRVPGTRLWGRVLRPSRTGPTRSYLAANLVADGRARTTTIHRLVAAAVLGPCPPGREVNHIDGDTFNNRPDNLEYVTKSQNGLHAAEVLGRHRGEASGAARLTEQQVREIRALAGTMPRTRIAARFGVSWGCVHAIIRRDNWRHL